MSDIFIDLTLKKLGDDDEYSLESALKNNSFVVLLGNPGSGKTTLLRHFEKNNRSAFYNVRDFLHDDEMSSNLAKKHYLLIDGFDELRSVSSDKYEPLYKISDKIKKIKKNNSGIHVVLSCRAIDWFGNDDLEILNKQERIAVFFIQPLNLKQKIDLIRLYLHSVPQIFLEKITSCAFLDNPQILTMFLDLYKRKSIKNFPRTKQDVYAKFIEFAREKDPKRQKNHILLTSDEIYKYAGYLAYYYIVAGTTSIDDKLVQDIADESKGFPIEKLRDVLNTNIFKDGGAVTFVHRTVAEFLCAKFLLNYTSLTTKRIINLCIIPQRDAVSSEYRGVFAWLSSFSENEEYFSIDPYGQYLYGDDSYFSVESKKRVLKGIRDYSKRCPYFLTQGRLLGSNTFYDSKLDDFLINEFESAKNEHNHYLFLLCDLLTSSKNPSRRCQEFAFKMICDKDLDDMYKPYLLPLLEKNGKYLNEIVKKILEGEIVDSDDAILDESINYLFPKIIRYDQIIGLIKKYKESSGIHRGHYSYLRYEIPYLEQKFIVSQIYDENSNKIRHNSFQKYSLEIFVGRFYYEMLQKKPLNYVLDILFEHAETDSLFYENALSNVSKKIQALSLKEKRKKYVDYLDYILPLDGRRIEDCRKKEFYLRHFEHSILPDNFIDILENKLQKSKQMSEKEFFLRKIYEGLCGKKETRKKAKKICYELANKFGLKDFWKAYWYKSPEERKYESENRRLQKEQKQRSKNIVQTNEMKFHSLTEEQKHNAWNFFFHVSSYYLHDFGTNEESIGLTSKTFFLILDLMKKSVLKNIDDSPYKTYITLDSLAQGAPGGHRNIDDLYYACLCLISPKEYKKISSNGFEDYLYILTILEKQVSNIRKASFDTYFEKNDPSRAISLLVNYMGKIIHFNIPQKEKVFSEICAELIKKGPQNKQIVKLKRLIYGMFSDTPQKCASTLFRNLLDKFGLYIPADLISQLDGINEEIDSKKGILLKLHSHSKDWTVDETVSLHQLIDNIMDVYSSLSEDSCYTLVNAFLNSFKSLDDLENPSGVLSPRDECVWFIRSTMWNCMIGTKWIKILKDLKKEHEDDYWTNRIQSKIYELEMKNNNRLSLFSKDVNQAKEFVFSEIFSNDRDFWLDVCEKLESIKDDIEKGEDNQKKIFEWTGKDENSCRDIIVQRWQDRYNRISLATREKYIGDKRVDINIKSRDNEKYVVRVECKVDTNKKCLQGINDQLIELYIKDTNVKYGVYLVFCFDKNPISLQEKLEQGITGTYKNNISVICIDLRKKMRK